MCNLEIFSLIFWTRDFGKTSQAHAIANGVDELVLENQLYEIESRNIRDGIKPDLISKGKYGPQLYE